MVERILRGNTRSWRIGSSNTVVLEDQANEAELILDKPPTIRQLEEAEHSIEHPYFIRTKESSVGWYLASFTQ